MSTQKDKLHGREPKTKCRDCGAKIGERHAGTCPAAICWKCRDPRQGCRCDAPAQDKEQFPFCGDLEDVFSNHNRYSTGLLLRDFDYVPVFRGGKLIALSINRVDVGVLQAVLQSAQSKDIIDFTCPHPQVNGQTVGDAVDFLATSPLREQLQSIQLGDMRRGWDRVADRKWDAPGSCENVGALVKLIEEMPALIMLRLCVALPSLVPIYTTKFPKKLRMMHVNAPTSAGLEALAANATLATIESLSLVHNRKDKPDDKGFHDHFAALVNSPFVEKIDTFAIEAPELDDQACKILGTAKMLEHLRKLRLGGTITDVGAAALADSPAMRNLEDVILDLTEIAPGGVEKMREAGIKVRPPHVEVVQYWLSFAGDDGFLGVCVVDGDLPGPRYAVLRAHELGINPGGEVLTVRIEPGNEYPAEHLNKLFTDKAEIKRIFDTE